MPLTLVVVQGRRSGEVYAFGADKPLLIGSAPQAQVRLPDQGVAAVHARLAPVAHGQWEILAAPGLTLVVNSRPVTRAPVQVGDRIELGTAAMAVSACTRSATDRLPQQPPAAAGAAPGGLPGAALHFLNGPSKGRQVVLGASTTLGRAPTADVPLLDGRCSRIHARVERRARGYVVLDMGSTNGTRVNGQPLVSGAAQPLTPGDWVQTGSTVLEFHYQGDGPRLRETQPIPVEDEAIPLDSLGRQAPTDRMPTGRAPQGEAVLVGDLRRMPFADVVQFLSLSQKTGELVIEHPSGVWRLALNNGSAVHAAGPQPWPPERTFQAMIRLDQGRFKFLEGPEPETVTLRSSTQALLMEALRLQDEETTDSFPASPLGL